MKLKGYTLWLVPTGEAFEKFNNLIQRLSKQYYAPVFRPHVTLLGEFLQTEEECIEKTKELVKGQKSFTLELGQIYYEDFFFRTLFVKAKITEELQALHDRAKQIFNMTNIPQYMAHLSLLYGTFPVELKEKIIKEIGRDQSAQWEVNKVTLIKGGEVDDWQIVGEFPFKIF
ncbi:MAG: 2'-5' RNA ligase family protein [Candidatus Daviesbacteria bacterium]|nr:2'-5' RNA ligase family protein [Candidatus Daviesbacteria bacterium]